MRLDLGIFRLHFRQTKQAFWSSSCGEDRLEEACQCFGWMKPASDCSQSKMLLQECRSRPQNDSSSQTTTLLLLMKTAQTTHNNPFPQLLMDIRSCLNSLQLCWSTNSDFELPQPTCQTPKKAAAPDHNSATLLSPAVSLRRNLFLQPPSATLSKTTDLSKCLQAENHL